MLRPAWCERAWRCAFTAAKSLRAYSRALSSMSADVGENAIDVALKVAAALTAVGADYFLAEAWRVRFKVSHERPMISIS